MKMTETCGGCDRLLYNTPVSEIATRGVITAPRGVTIREAADVMSRNRISCVVLVDEGGVPSGIVTDRDLRDKVVARGRDVNDPVSEIMSVSLIRSDEREYCFESLMKMVRHGIHHLLVVGDGRMKGIITNHDLMLLQGSSPISAAREIEHQTTIDGLVPVAAGINKVFARLMSDGARAVNVGKIMSEITDRLLRRIIEISEKKLGRPPVACCWIVYGADGRRERSLLSGQRNAVIYADPAETEIASRAVEYFSGLSQAVHDSLARCGFAPSRAGFMAINRQWRQPLGVWKRYVTDWTSDPSAETTPGMLKFLDLRPVHGDSRLAGELRAHMKTMLESHEMFAGQLASHITANGSPVGLFRTIVVEKTGDHKKEINLMSRGIEPLVNIIRLFSIETGLDETSTIDRIAVLRNRHAIVEQFADEIIHAVEFMSRLLVQRQMRQMESGGEPDDYINPDKLTRMDRRSLHEALSLVFRLQNLVFERYKPLI